MAKKKVLLIAGHGEGDPGACSKWGQEANYTRELATLIEKALGSNVSVAMYNQNKNCYTQSRSGNVPRYTDYHFTLEIHFNAKTKKDENGDGYFTGVGGYIHPDNAGRTTARAIIDAVTALGFREWLLDTSTGLLNLNNAQRQGAKYFLLETAFIDDGDDMKFYCARKAQFAQAIADGILKGLGVKGSAQVPEGAVTTKDTYYRVRRTWADAKSQLFAGTKEGAIKTCRAGYSVFDPDGKCIYTHAASGTQGSDFAGLSEADAIEKMIPLYMADGKKTGIDWRISMAQGILESGYFKTDLAQNANNVHGMKTSLSGNTWAGSTWDGGSYYEKDSPEFENGKTAMRRSKFRAYESIEDSIADHSAYLIGAMNGSARRYPGIEKIRNYKEAARLIKAGGYATDPEYADKLIRIIEKWGLNTRKEDGTIQAPADRTEQLIRVSCGHVVLLQKKGTDYIYTGKVVDPGVYTLVDIEGSLGKLKSGAGYIPVDFVEFC